MTAKKSAKQPPAEAGGCSKGERRAFSQAMRSILIDSFLSAIEAGDPTAAPALHGLLAEALRAGDLTDQELALLADMHESIARGKPADVAMMTNKLPIRPRKILRDQLVINHVDGMIQMKDRAKRVPKVAELAGGLATMSKEEIYRVAGKRVGMDGGDVKRIYLRYLKHLRQRK